MKTLDERKSFLKEHYICYKFCNSTNHRAKECKTAIRCSECNSDRHVSALHDSPPPWIARESITTVEGHGEEQTENTSVIHSAAQKSVGRACMESHVQRCA